MQKNENRPGTKKTKAGWIPEGWEAVRLTDLTSTPVKNGYSPNCPDTPTGKWVLGLGALNGQGFDPTKIKPSPLDNGLTDSFLLSPGDFLISRSNTKDKVGRAALFRGEVQNCSYPDLMMRFRANETVILPDYLDRALRSPNPVRYLQRSASGTSGSMIKINKTTVEKLPLPLPPLPEQEGIAGVLECWDRGIKNLELKIGKKRLIKKEYFRFSNDCSTYSNSLSLST